MNGSETSSDLGYPFLTATSVTGDDDLVYEKSCGCPKEALAGVPISRKREHENVFEDIVGPNPFYTGRMAEVDILKSVLAVTAGRTSCGLGLVNINMLDVLRSHRPTVAGRILRISNHRDVVQIRSPPGGIVNLSVAEPELYKVKNNALFSIKHDSFVVASLTGVTTYFVNDPYSICEIGVRPFFHCWPRFTAVIGRLFRSDTLYFSTRKGGVKFTSSFIHDWNEDVPKETGKRCAPISGSALAMHEKIPIYDGREEFTLSQYWKKEYVGDVKPGSTVVVLFSVKQGPLPTRVKISQWMKGVYLFVLGVIVIAEPAEPFCLDTSPVPTDVQGVSYLRRLLTREVLDEEDDGGESEDVDVERF